jgi:hypothetical protein
LHTHSTRSDGELEPGAVVAAYRERGEELTKVRLALGQFRRSYARPTVIDAAGKRAWSNPFWLD